MLGAELPAWFDHAACRGKSGWFFPPSARGVEGRAERDRLDALAKACCAACPGLVECAEWSVREKHGTWGGRTAEERRPPRRRPVRVAVEVSGEAS
jgi:hypothetical protein